MTIFDWYAIGIWHDGMCITTFFCCCAVAIGHPVEAT